MKEKINVLFMTSRPLSWVNTAYPFAAGYVVMGGAIDARLIIGTLFFLIPYNLLMYGINDVCDYESDMRNPRKGGVEGAVTPRKYHRLIVWSAVLTCLPFVRIRDERSAEARAGWRRFLWLNYVAGAVVTVTLLMKVWGV